MNPISSDLNYCAATVRSDERRRRFAHSRVLLEGIRRRYLLYPFACGVYGLVLAALVCGLPRAACAEAGPSEKVVRTVNEVRRAVRDRPEEKEITELDQTLRDIVFPAFDFEHMARACLGPHWRSATPEQRKEFIRLFSDLLARTYLSKVKARVGDSALRIASERIEKDRAHIDTVVTEKGEALRIGYRMHKNGDDWRVYDVLVENVGLVSTYRGEFGAIVRKGGMETLISRLREKQKVKA